MPVSRQPIKESYYKSAATCSPAHCSLTDNVCVGSQRWAIRVTRGEEPCLQPTCRVLHRPLVVVVGEVVPLCHQEVGRRRARRVHQGSRHPCLSAKVGLCPCNTHQQQAQGQSDRRNTSVGPQAMSKALCIPLPPLIGYKAAAACGEPSTLPTMRPSKKAVKQQHGLTRHAQRPCWGRAGGWALRLQAGWWDHTCGCCPAASGRPHAHAQAARAAQSPDEPGPGSGPLQPQTSSQDRHATCCL